MSHWFSLPTATRVLITGFWLGMNLALVWIEFGARTSAAVAGVPVETVLRKIVTAEEICPLEIRHQGRRIGFCKWTTGVLRDPVDTGGGLGQEGMAKRVLGYTINFDGNVELTGFRTPMHFSFALELDPQLTWRRVELAVRSGVGESRVWAESAAGQLWLMVAVPGMPTMTNALWLADAHDPETVLGFVSGAVPDAGLAAVLPGFIASRGTTRPHELDSDPMHGRTSLRAYNSVLRVGSADVRVYVLELAVSGRERARAYVSRFGEILRAELPSQVTLHNTEAFP